MRKYTEELIKSFKSLCKEGSNNTARQRIALGRAIVVEAGIDLKEYTETRASPLFSDMASSFREMIEKGWIQERSLDREQKSIAYSDYEEHITKSGLTYSSDFDYTYNRLRIHHWPLGDNWFLLTTKGEEFIETGLGKTKEKKYNILEEVVEYEGETKDDRQYRCFVIMPIGKEGTVEYENNMMVYNKIIKPSVENSGYNIKCYHADLISESGDISRQVIEALRDDDIVIADLRRNNPNVIYELGIRHTFGKRSILICSEQSDHFFHTTKYRAIRYKIDGTSNKEFYNKLNRHIDAIIKNPEKSDNPVVDTLGIRIGHVKKEISGGGIVKKRLYVSRLTKGIYSLGEVYNKSDDDIIDLDIILEYIDKMGAEQKVNAKMINSFDDPMRARPYTARLLKKKEAKHITDFPRTKTKVIIQGRISDSDEILGEEFDVPEVVG